MSNHINRNQVLDAARIHDVDVPERKVAVFDLAEGQTAWLPGTEKSVIVGPGRVEYVVRPEQVLFSPLDGTVDYAKA